MKFVAINVLIILLCLHFLNGDTFARTQHEYLSNYATSIYGTIPTQFVISSFLTTTSITSRIPGAGIAFTTSSKSLPYGEGDWLKYVLEVESQGKSCWVEIKVTILNVDGLEVRTRAEVVKTGGDTNLLSMLHLREGSSNVIELNLAFARIAEDLFVDPSISGTYQCEERSFLISEITYCDATYKRGVFIEGKQEGYTFMVGGFKTRMRLIDSSIGFLKTPLSEITLTFLFIMLSLILITGRLIGILLWVARRWRQQLELSPL